MIDRNELNRPFEFEQKLIVNLPKKWLWLVMT